MESSTGIIRTYKQVLCNPTIDGDTIDLDLVQEYLSEAHSEIMHYILKEASTLYNDTLKANNCDITKVPQQSTLEGIQKIADSLTQVILDTKLQFAGEGGVIDAV